MEGLIMGRTVQNRKTIADLCYDGAGKSLADHLRSLVADLEAHPSVVVIDISADRDSEGPYLTVEVEGDATIVADFCGQGEG
jgi:hypothetical protein